jgi:AmmeMemoRadiSam system protein B
MFYPGDGVRLKAEVNRLLQPSKKKRKALGIISPHAGYTYSGGCAGSIFGKVKVPDIVIVLGVNHRGFGHPFAIDGNESWQTPLGEVAVATELARTLAEESTIFSIDNIASAQEHSLEVQIPFIQVVNPQARILPITIASAKLDKLLAGGSELGEILIGSDNVLVVASTDMSHYIDAETAKTKDMKAIERILELDPEGLLKTVTRESISMCGVSPTVMMLAAAVKAGARHAEVVEYTHSGKVSGDYNEVVAYLSMMIY